MCIGSTPPLAKISSVRDFPGSLMGVRSQQLQQPNYFSLVPELLHCGELSLAGQMPRASFARGVIVPP
jgi:hypothetical protein